jgi:hypothetical protein
MADSQKPKISSVWTANGKRYVVIGNDRTTKDADAANWSTAIEYQIIDASEPVRIRTLDDFLAKLTPEQ